MTAAYRVVVRNAAATSANRIHADEVAKGLGFRGGLVPGAVTYGHLCPAVVVALGAEWLRRGEAVVRFLRPVYDGDAVEVTTELTAAGATVRARNEGAEECVTLTATLPTARATPGSPGGLRLAPLHETLAVEDAGPAGLLHLANRLVGARFDISPWIHAGSRVRHWRELRAGAPVEVQGALAALYERGGRRFFDLEALVLSGGEPAGEVRHTVLYDLAPREAST